MTTRTPGSRYVGLWLVTSNGLRPLTPEEHSFMRNYVPGSGQWPKPYLRVVKEYK